MIPLRQRMITAMQMHGYSPRTHESYLAAGRGLAKYTHRSPESLSHDDLRAYSSLAPFPHFSRRL